MKITAHFKILAPWFTEYEDRILEGTQGEIDIQLGQAHDGIAAAHGVDPEQVELYCTSKWEASR